MAKVTIVGAGGHAKVVIATARAAGLELDAIVDDDPAARGRRVLDLEVIGDVGVVLDDPDRVALLAVGSNAARARLAARARCAFATAVHPTAVVDDSVLLAPGTVVFANAVIQPDAVLGAHVIVNTSASIDHDCAIGDFAHVSPGVHLAGQVIVGEGAFLGIGAAVIPGVRIGAWATIGAGAAVVRDVADRVTAVGVPARPRRT
jgi:sugar O-acyltransferase (sialic acid O-acetyltransferase NeuD family)